MNRTQRALTLSVFVAIVTSSGAVAVESLKNFEPPCTGKSHHCLDKRLDAVEDWIQTTESKAPKPTPSPDPSETPSPEPDPTTPAPEPDPTTPAPDPTTPAPDPEPTTPTPEPDPTTPAPEPDPTTPAPDPTTPAPDPDPTTPAPEPDPEPTTPAPSPTPTTPPASGQTPFAHGATGATNTTVRATLPAGASLREINAAIQSASSAGGGIVKLNAGTYTVNGRVVMHSNVKLEGPDVPTGTQPKAIIKAGSSFISNPMYNGYSVITNVWGAKNFTLDDIMADQSGDVLNGNVGGRLSAYLVEARAAENVVFDQVWTRRPFTYSIVMADTVKFGIRNSDVQVNTTGKYNQLDGIHILHGSHGDVVDNKVDTGFTGPNGDGDDGLVAHTIGDVVHDVNYVNNWVRGGQHGHSMQLAGGSYDIYNINIRKNTFACVNATDAGVRFGYYGSSGSEINNITVGGASGQGNTFIDCRSHAVDFDDGPARNITVTHNRKDSTTGPYRVPSGNNNVVANNTVY